MPNVVLLSPNLYGDYSVCVAELLWRRGIPTSAIFVRRMLNIARIRAELRQFGPRQLAKKIQRKLLFRDLAHKGVAYETLRDLRRQADIRFTSLRDFAAARGAVVHTCDDLSDPAVCDVIRREQPAAVVFTGGGLLRKPLLEASGWRIVNVHPGLLPSYRGMDCLEWAVLEGHPEKVGMSAHLMDEGVDTGPLLEVRPVPLTATDTTFEHLRARLEPIACRLMTDAVAGFVNGEIEPRSQAITDGRQFFAMHPDLLAKASAKLNWGLTV